MSNFDLLYTLFPHPFSMLHYLKFDSNILIHIVHITTIFLYHLYLELSTLKMTGQLVWFNVYNLNMRNNERHWKVGLTYIFIIWRKVRNFRLQIWQTLQSLSIGSKFYQGSTIAIEPNLWKKWTHAKSIVSNSRQFYEICICPILLKCNFLAHEIWIWWIKNVQMHLKSPYKCAISRKLEGALYCRG